MAKFIVQGNIALEGSIDIKGFKNAALPLLACSILTDQECIFSNVPKIRDIRFLIEIIEHLGAQIKWLEEEKISITCKKLYPQRLQEPDILYKVRLLRASVLLVAPILARFGEITMPYPGGCLLGKRPLDAHFDALEKMGAQIKQKGDFFTIKNGQKLTGRKIFLNEASVTATENLLMAATLSSKTTIIRNAASEPHVENVADFLNKMGADIEGQGSNSITINGVKSLKGASIKVIPDQLEVGSLAIAAACTKGHVTLNNVEPDHLDPILLKLDEAKVNFSLTKKSLTILPPKGEYQATNIRTNIWPGFPTDLQAPFCVLATQSIGNSMIHDWMYEGRLFYIDKLNKMGADITMADPHRVIVSGPTPLRGKEIESPDIRAGMAMLIAALAATGKSVIEHIELIDRGYLDIDKRLAQVGAKIERIP